MAILGLVPVEILGVGGVSVVSGTVPVSTASNSPTFPPGANLSVTGTAASGAGVTVTLPAAGAGLFHYIVGIEIQEFAVAALTAAAVPVVVTTTNFPAATTFNFQAGAAAQGSLFENLYQPTTPIKSSVANTNTTIVAPATTSVIWNINVFYYTGA